VAWKFNSETPVSKQIAQRIRLEIVNNKYALGEQFPSVRAMADESGVNPNTVQKALTFLEDEGLLVVKGTVGRFVTEDESIIARTKKQLQESYVRRMIKEAKALNISHKELIAIIEEMGDA